VNGRRHVVEVIDGSAETEKSKGGKLLLRIKITAEVDGVRSEYEITYGRYEKTRLRASPTPAPTRREAGRQTRRGSPPWLRP
jgi:hypothetical protein